VRIDVNLPEQRARCRVHCVRIRSLIAEESRQPVHRAAAGPNDDGTV